MISKEAGYNRERFSGTHKVSSQGDIFKWKHQLDAHLFVLFLSFFLFFLFVKLHYTYNCMCFDTIRFDNMDVLGCRELVVTIDCLWGVKYKDS